MNPNAGDLRETHPASFRVLFFGEKKRVGAPRTGSLRCCFAPTVSLNRTKEEHPANAQSTKRSSQDELHLFDNAPSPKNLRKNSRANQVLLYPCLQRTRPKRPFCGIQSMLRRKVRLFVRHGFGPRIVQHPLQVRLVLPLQALAYPGRSLGRGRKDTLNIHPLLVPLETET